MIAFASLLRPVSSLDPACTAVVHGSFMCVLARALRYFQSHYVRSFVGNPLYLHRYAAIYFEVGRVAANFDGVVFQWYRGSYAPRIVPFLVIERRLRPCGATSPCSHPVRLTSVCHARAAGAGYLRLAQ
eukprot:CAMPEP_0179007012 /NCGR_PEP_ID=MMETSP0795-20121207/14903_1 /TAXON_ID=88552 /ORGANISM="Amoebophrya sp., Strain Ameob2" /LENGTH=128 /DNA_ID=CAMNT_0020701897 /DNA_START=214 /DNA_END=597 /DNA_ORIENTATION=-